MAIEIIATNRRARHEYEIIDTFEAGIQLTGPEVKSARAHRVSLAEAYATVENGEVWLVGMHISRYDAGGYAPQDPMRPRKLLLHRREIDRLAREVAQKGHTLVPLRIYFAPSGYAKVELGVARGKKQYEKRDAIKTRDEERRAAQAIADHYRGR